ncbi:MAG: OB-fold putative lipoprotein [Selenomonas sp.]|uniref:OB-fold protein n=1 Tax=Selenomonas sp. TaxID=2053611 RepID=UPI0025D2DF79|nr:hypothetical protein [Selenomonas sp.]MCI6231473.1 OB-fold putative lipoprotein [Selenomonas sp.]
MKRFLAVVMLVFVSVFAIAGCGGSSSSPSSSSSSAKEVSYAEADIAVLMSELKDNAAAASKNYKGKDVKVVNGVVSNIDADGKYFNIQPAGAQFDLHSMQCFINDDKLKDDVVKLKKGAPVVVYGHIDDVGEVLGYSLNTKKIEISQ